MKVNRDVKSRYLKPDHRSQPYGHEIWTEDGKLYRHLYSLLSKLDIINTKKMSESLNDPSNW